MTCQQFYASDTVLSFRSYAILMTITLWGTRLTLNWALHFSSWEFQDWRYVKLRDDLTKNVPHFLALPFYWIILRKFV